MEKFCLGIYKGLEVKPFSCEVTADELDSALRTLAGHLEGDELLELPDLRESLREQLRAEKEKRQAQADMNRVLAAVGQRCTFVCSQAQVEELTNRLCGSLLAELADEHHLQVKSYLRILQLNPGELLDECRQVAIDRLLGEAVLDAVAEAEGLVLDEADGVAMATEGLSERQLLRAKAMSLLLSYNLCRS
ncbi:MAG: hypothetical protein LBK67_06825 [Coriobacteriales bacterium]|jgi:FKBP-type peptidyl-prolyl cis-trans isomerase (trigger factor)|nr:hypothetical protein [Coriobacteriales bacterium]